MRVLFFLLLIFLQNLYAITLQEKIKALIPSSTYKSNENFIRKIFSDEKSFYTNKDFNIEKILKTLKSNGLLPLKLQKPSNVEISFRVNALSQTDSNPSFIFLNFATSNLLTNMGYKSFYTSKARKLDNQFLISYIINTESNLDPTILLANLAARGYITLDVQRYNDKDWIFDITLRRTSLTNTNAVQKGSKELTQINGKYWLSISGSGTLNITANNEVKWYPKVIMFDKDMNMVNVIMLENSSNSYSLKITNDVKYLMITDNYNSTNLRSGIVLSYR